MPFWVWEGMDVGVRSSSDIYDPIGQLVELGVPQNRRRKVVTLVVREAERSILLCSWPTAQCLVTVSTLPEDYGFDARINVSVLFSSLYSYRTRQTSSFLP
jgi:hypothetical protein